MNTSRRFPPPWSVDELDSCFRVKDANGQALAYMYFEKEPRRRFRRCELLARDEAERIAACSPSCHSYCAAANSAFKHKEIAAIFAA